MLTILLAMTAPTEMPDLHAAVARYQAMAAEAATTGDTSWMMNATVNVCSIAYRYTLTRGDGAAADIVASYNGPSADRLKLSCIVYFQEHVQ